MKFTPLELDRLKNINPESVDRDSLVDIREIEIDRSKPHLEQVLDFLTQIKNPYLYRCGNVVVKVAYKEDTTITIEDQLEHLIRENIIRNLSSVNFAFFKLF